MMRWKPVQKRPFGRAYSDYLNRSRLGAMLDEVARAAFGPPLEEREEAQVAVRVAVEGRRPRRRGHE